MPPERGEKVWRLKRRNGMPEDAVEKNESRGEWGKLQKSESRKQRGGAGLLMIGGEIGVAGDLVTSSAPLHRNPPSIVKASNLLFMFVLHIP